MDRKKHQKSLTILQDKIRLLRKLFRPEKAILFGSWARGDYLYESDFDLIVVSRFFEGINFRDRISGIWALGQKQNLDILCYTPE